jgi:beta-N-acetylhexosaminidase
MNIFLSEKHKLKNQAGSLMLIGWEGNDLDEPLQLIENYAPAGLIFFSRNYPPGGGKELAAQLAACQDLSQKLWGRPLLMALDNEGGLVKRLPSPHIQLPGAPLQAKRGIGHIRIMSYLAGCELKVLGFNLNLAPVLDLAIPGGIMVDRSFGSDPSVVTSCAQAFIKGFKEASVFCCAKHFPGLGAAMVDPHHVLPTVELSLDQMAQHLKPFDDLVRNGLELVMTSHSIYPALEEPLKGRGKSQNKPATFAPEIVNLIRERFGFNGLILSDDLEMGAVAHRLQSDQAATEAILAGHDLILVCRKIGHITEAHRSLMTALTKGMITFDRFKASYSRLEKLLLKLDSFSRK